MDRVAPLEFDPSAPTDRLLADVERWIRSEPVSVLVSMFDGPDVLAATPLGELLDELADFSVQWDFRRGEERNLAQTAEFADEHAAQIVEAADALGLVHTTRPRHESYDHLVVLGGLIRACILRPRFAAELVAEGLNVGTVTGIGAFRPLKGDEPDLAVAAGLPEVDTEFAAMVAGMSDAFGVGAPDETAGETVEDNPNLSWEVAVHHVVGGPTIRVVAAPTTDPTRRANTPDSYQYLADELVHIKPGDRVLAVTSAIYVPFQGADAIRMLGLPYRAVVDCGGLDVPVAREPELVQLFTPANYLQEVRSAFLALRNLFTAINDRT